MEPTLTDQLLAALMPTILAILAILGSIVTIKLNGYLSRLSDATGVEIDAKHRDALMLGLRNAVLLLVAGRANDPRLNILDVWRTGADIPDHDIKFVIDRVRQRYPDAVDHFGLTEKALRDMAVAQIESVKLSG
ncbi:hypothetical protein PARHAE_03239 [Paracoccus haematequi]|uniref:Uncharacterized protein n=1 Tax=Paracoccus haematequi TaxID=2491866 RepID=A0A447IRB4_9RHOB|nr:hypothetical protein [Paracoccus haematequi]VDS10028.1 hypothetical protein PARHAE_03239 [Paracoccus haematequi]